jgi:argininosuccinate synthase
MKKQIKKAILAYSGGLDTSIIIPWLKENYGCAVIAVAADVGQGDAELEGLEQKALKTGATACYIEDLKEDFVVNYIFPTVKAGAIYEQDYLLGTSFARPIIAKRLVEIAHREGADAICHGCTGKGNDQVRLSCPSRPSTRRSPSSPPGGSGTSLPGTRRSNTPRPGISP